MGPFGLFEHAEGTKVRRNHGYCTDDNARLLILTSVRPQPLDSEDLSRQALQFVCAAQQSSGWVHNRMSPDGHFTDEPSNEDCWGRVLQSCGLAAALHPQLSVRREAAVAFDLSAQARSPHLRAMAFASVGAAHFLREHPDDQNAHRLLTDFVRMVTTDVKTESSWLWPEPRLRYANATVAEAMIAAGAALKREEVVLLGVRLLTWLIARESRNGQISVTGTKGRGPNEMFAQFDQQPIEVSAIADACMGAFEATGDHAWLDGVLLAANWFFGENDSNAIMFDPRTGGGFDGLQRRGVNTNQGAESTLAYLNTAQRLSRAKHLLHDCNLSSAS